jgi:branched-chain amino acid transport system ATP-binding protein
MLKVEGLAVNRGAVQVLWGVDLHVAAGEIVALIGANGAGKTTTLSAISGMLPARSGRIHLTTPNGDVDITNRRSDELVSLGLAHCPEGRQVFPTLTVEENLRIGAFQRNEKTEVDRDLERINTLFPILGERRNQAAGGLSGGQQMMVAIGRALMSRPKLLLLDEPSLGLAPNITEQIFDIILQVNAEGTTILLVEQNAMIALEIADRAYVLESGRLLKSGDAQDLLRDDAVRQAYLGGAH